MDSKENTAMGSDLSLGNAAKIAGIGYLMVFIVSIFGKALALDKIIIMGDAITTANNIIANRELFRFGITCWLIVMVFDAIVAWALYILLKPTNKNLALLSTWFRLIFVAIFGYSFVSLFSVLQLFSGAEYLKIFDASQLQA